MWKTHRNTHQPRLHILSMYWRQCAAFGWYVKQLNDKKKEGNSNNWEKGSGEKKQRVLIKLLQGKQYCFQGSLSIMVRMENKSLESMKGKCIVIGIKHFHNKIVYSLKLCLTAPPQPPFFHCQQQSFLLHVLKLNVFKKAARKMYYSWCPTPTRALLN